MNGLFLQAIGGKVQISAEEMAELRRLYGERDRLNEQLARYGNRAARDAIKAAHAQASLDYSSESFKALEATLTGQPEAEERFRELGRTVRTAIKTFWVSEFAPLLRKLNGRAFAIVSARIAELRQPEQELAAAVGVDYLPSSGVDALAAALNSHALASASLMDDLPGEVPTIEEWLAMASASAPMPSASSDVTLPADLDEETKGPQLEDRPRRR